MPAVAERVREVAAVDGRLPDEMLRATRPYIVRGLAAGWPLVQAARRYGAEEEVLRSLHQSFPEMGWNDQQPHSLISRIAEHGRRRAEEMEEVAKTAADVGITPHMSQATVLAQRGLVDAMAAQGLNYAALEPFDWTRLADTLAHRG